MTSLHRRFPQRGEKRRALVALLAILAAPLPSTAQEQPEGSRPAPPRATEPEAADQMEPERTEEEGDDRKAASGAEKPCSFSISRDATWLDRTQNGMASTVCRAVAWFDGLFGDERLYEEHEATFGRVQPTLDWNEIDGIDPGLEFRVKVSLPQLDDRMSALFGRDAPENLIEDSARSRDGLLPDVFRDTDDEWLVGLGYTPVRGARRRLDFSAGLEVRAPPEVFVQGRYRRQWFLNDRNLLRLRETPFWRSDDGIGASTRLDLERVVGSKFLLRWRNVGTVAQRIEGVEWFEEVSLFHRLSAKSALAYVVEAAGETEADVTVDHYGVVFIYRRQVLREWLFLELRPGLSWRREDPSEDREATPVLGLGIEMQFGKQPFS